MRSLIFTSLLVPAGCDSVTVRCAALAQTPPAVQLGKGPDRWQPLANHDTLPVDFGPQGGWHTYGSLRTSGLYGGTGRFDGTSPTLTLIVNALDGTFTGGYRDIARPLRSGPDDTYELLHDPLILTITDAAQADGARARLEAIVSDVCGRSAEATAEVLLSIRD